jgi:hypothetical protein
MQKKNGERKISKKSNVLMASENESAQARGNAAKGSSSQCRNALKKKIWGINATTQTSGEIEDGENAFDSKHLFMKSCNISRRNSRKGELSDRALRFNSRN